MYHIHHDKRSEHSAEKIYTSLSTLMNEKPYDKITISDLTRSSGLSRATFYRSFDSVDDVLNWKLDQKYKEMNEKFEKEGVNPEDQYAYLHHFFTYWLKDQNSLILEQLIQIGHYDVIYHIHCDNSMLIRRAVAEKLPEMDAYYDYYMLSLIGAFIGFLITWISHGRVLSADEVIHLLQSALDPDFRQI